ncbi:ArsR/SmtB family transcription factor [Brucella intermedia]|uniref:ArsR/SmtB family transcription factor n=1 Tax=Brucella intermedia TaxID=94625 RepID=UPI0009B890F9|nr:metalloregulator ArsR/SmtB family transcription factor [Brucella intermedia]
MAATKTKRVEYRNLLNNLSEAADLLTLLANPTRLWILHRVLYREVSVSALAEELNVSCPVVSQHLSRLRDADLVMTRREKQTVYYTTSSPHLELLLSTFDSLYLGEIMNDQPHRDPHQSNLRRRAEALN